MHIQFESHLSHGLLFTMRKLAPTKTCRSPRSTHPSPLKDSSNLQRQKPAKRHAIASLDLLQEAIDKEGTEKEQTEQDFAHIAQLEESIVHAQTLSKRLEIKLHETRNSINATMKENTRIKRLFSALQVQRKDFDLEGIYGEQPRKRRMIDIGNRLIDNLNGVNQHMAGNAGANGTTTGAATDDGAGSNNSLSDNTKSITDSQKLQQQKTGRVSGGAGGETPAPTLVGADRQEHNQAQKPALTPPAQFPAESQIAAAALTLSQGDPAAALLSLLEKAMAARTAEGQPLWGGVPTEPQKSLSVSLQC